ncbi:MAG TPA: hypothetical protein VN256_17190 [Pyrinomonadaceae bacterium]|nr:hypothetical protein [Pyrinomonadaceae bacterium]
MSRLIRARVALCLIALAAPAIVRAQAPQGKEAAPAKATKKAAAKRAGASNPLAEQRRTTAITLISSLADEARGYQDQTLRARVLARAADAVWETDAERARNYFQRAWESAESADAESQRRMEEDIRRQQRESGGAAYISPPSLRNEVLRLAARRDRALGEGFLKRIEDARERAPEIAPPGTTPWMSTPTDSQRLRLAMQLLQDDDVERALQYADRVLITGTVTRDSIDFLSALREKDAKAADQRYVSMLHFAAADGNSDANTVSGLASYAFTPFLYIVFEPGGGASHMQRRALTPAPALPREVRAEFFRTAAQILLRPLPPPGQDRTSAGRTGKYLVIKRLLPLFDQHAPELAAEMRAHMAALTPDVNEQARTGENRAVNVGIVPEDESRDPMRELEERLKGAADQGGRDAIYADVAVGLAGSGDPRAADLVDKIEDSELRKQARAYVDFQYMNNALQKKDAEGALRFARSGELTHIQRVWGLTQAARLLLKTDRARSLELLEEAATEARRIGGGEADRPRALVAVTKGFLEADRARAWELVSDVVRAGNSAEGFTGDDARLSVTLRYRNGVMMNSVNATDFDLPGLFRGLARDDLYRAIESAKSFTAEAPRANAHLAIARAVLEERPKPEGGKQKAASSKQ